MVQAAGDSAKPPGLPAWPQARERCVGGDGGCAGPVVWYQESGQRDCCCKSAARYPTVRVRGSAALGVVFAFLAFERADSTEIGQTRCTRCARAVSSPRLSRLLANHGGGFLAHRSVSAP